MELDLSKRRASLSGDGGKLEVVVVDERVLLFMGGCGSCGVVKSRVEDMLEGSKFPKIQLLTSFCLPYLSILLS